MPITPQQAQQVIKEHFNAHHRLFSSHQFIRKYRKMYEEEYISDLYDAINKAKPGKRPNGGIGFRVVNGDIAKFLKNNENNLGIKKISGKFIDTTDFDMLGPNAIWQKQ